MKKTCMLTLALVLFTVVFAQAAKVYTVAVADFDAQNMSGYDSMAVTEFFRGGMVNSGLCRIINRNSMAMVLDEQKFQMSGCTDQDCVVKMGKLLNAEKIISGKIVSFNDEYYINAKVIDVETGEIQYSEQIKCKDKTEMPKKAEELAWLVTEKISQKKPMLRDVFEKRKKLAIYLCSLTPLVSIPGTNSTFKGFGYDGSNLNVKINETALTPVNAGVGIKIFPWKNICADISVMNDITQNISANQTLVGHPDLSSDYKIAFKQQVYIFNAYYLFQPEKAFSYNIGIGEIRSSLYYTSYIYEQNGTSSDYTSILSEAYTESIYFVNAGINYKPIEDVSISADAICPVTQYKAFSQRYVSQTGEKEMETKPQALIALKLSASYHFNF